MSLLTDSRYFNADTAVSIGLHEAIIGADLVCQLRIPRNGRELRGGRYWVPFRLDDLQSYHSFLTSDQIKETMQSLQDQALLHVVLACDMEDNVVYWVTMEDEDEPVAPVYQRTVTKCERLAVHGYVYLLRGTDGHYKIGRSKKPVERIARLGVDLPFPIEVEHVIESDDYFRAEKNLHAKFAILRKAGEWFTLSPDDVAWIKTIQHFERDTTDDFTKDGTR